MVVGKETMGMNATVTPIMRGPILPRRLRASSLIKSKYKTPNIKIQSNAGEEDSSLRSRNISSL